MGRVSWTGHLFHLIGSQGPWLHPELGFITFMEFSLYLSRLFFWFPPTSSCFYTGLSNTPIQCVVPLSCFPNQRSQDWVWIHRCRDLSEVRWMNELILSHDDVKAPPALSGWGSVSYFTYSTCFRKEQKANIKNDCCAYSHCSLVKRDEELDRSKTLARWIVKRL